jgi:putative ABC transport system permease protein
VTLGWAAAWRMARRGLDWRFRGLRLLALCLVLGVAALSAIGTLTGAIENELASRGRVFLGGDLEVMTVQRAATAQERAAIAGLGELSEGVRLQAMARDARDPGTGVPIDLKAVDRKWPLYGQLTLMDGRKTGAPQGMTAWISTGVADRMGVKVGDRLLIGQATVTVGGVIADEPDRLGEGFSLGPAIIVSREALAASQLVQPGSMVRMKYRLRLPDSADPAVLAEQITQQFPDAGFEIRTRDKAAPGLDRFVDRMGQFLVLVALAALAIAGIGIGNGVTSYLEARRGSIATLKILGATSGDIARIYLLQLAAAAGAAIVAGLAAGLAVTPLLGRLLSGLLPIETGFVFDPAALLIAATYGTLIAVTFAAPPLLRARDFPAMALMRARVSPLARQWRAAAVPVGLGLGGIAALAVATSPQPLLAAGFLAGAGALFVLLAALGQGVTRLAARLPRPKNPVTRIALANLHRPGAQTSALVVALGFGLAAFVVLAGVQTSLDKNIAARVPERAPDYFVLDMPQDRAAAFAAEVRKVAPKATLRTVPALRGSIIAYGPDGAMTRVADLKTIPEDAWVLRGDRGVTYAEDLPEGNSLTAGSWWPKNYTGPPLVSVDERVAEALDLKLGDRITITLLGIERSATIASFRRIDWDSMGFNYVMVFSPNSLRDVPHNLAATIELPRSEKTALVRAGLLSTLVRGFPSSSVIEIGPVISQARTILSQMGTAILAAASVAILAGLAVLTGAIAAARAARVYDTVILRVLGASRRQLLTMLVAEYGLLCALLAAVALALGTGTAWLIVVQLFEFEWLPGWPRILGVLGGGIALVMGFALAGSYSVIRTRPAQVLREL